MCVGAGLGGIAWLVFPPSPFLPGAFLSIVLAAWLAAGIWGFLRAELTLAGRGGRSPTTYTGWSARIVSLLVIAATLAFAFGATHAQR